MSGSFSFVLHTHLPWVLNHGKWPHGTDWLCEAAAECYIPLIAQLRSLHKRGIHARLSMDFSPVDLEQIADPAFPQIFLDYCDEKISYAEKDYHHYTHIGDTALVPTTEFWREYYLDKKDRFIREFDGNIVRGFRELSDLGILDAMTCGATHGYFPLLLDDRNILAQLRVAIDTHTEHFGKKPRGVWLPECGYRPAGMWSPPAGPAEIQRRPKQMRRGIEELVVEAGLEYFVIDGHLLYGDSRGDASLTLEEKRDALLREGRKLPSLATIYEVESHDESMMQLPYDACVFAREAKTAMQVWSSDHGYPGGAAYLDFSKKHTSGLRYWRVTGKQVDIGDKLPYVRDDIEQQIADDALDFVQLVRTQLAEHEGAHTSCGLITAPFDTELFGHWWFEGPRFLAKMMEAFASIDDVIVTNLAEAIDTPAITREKATLAPGSWGFMGTDFVWMNPRVRWMWDFIYPLEQRWLKLLDYLKASFSGLTDREIPEALFMLVEQAAREVLLVEASDWPFLVTNYAAEDYATLRLREHAEALRFLLDTIDSYLNGEGLDEEESAKLTEIAVIDRPFQEINLAHWGSAES